ncbi:MAG: HD domain-containing protein, partial [Pyrinomonadaceae bacterium]
MLERIYRDPVHNIIRLRSNSDVGRLLIALVDSQEFQRLRRIKQLGLALYTYQGAEHSRFTHSLGVLHLMIRALDRLAERYSISETDRAAACTAALLHDIGHGPFSHVMEKVMGFHHEQWSVSAILSDQTEVGQKLRQFSTALPQRIADIIEGRFEPTYIAQLVSSQLDVDRMDYLLRDSLMTGVKYGIYDLEWILGTLEIDDKERIYVAAPGLYAVEAYLQARYYMFRQVYFHRTLRSAEVVLRTTLRRALDLAKSGHPVWTVPGTAFEQLLYGGKPLLLTEYLELDDADLLFHIKQWQKSEDPILGDLSRRFIGRQLFKAIDLDMPEEEGREKFIELGRECAARLGFDPNYYFIDDNTSDLPYYPYDPEVTDTDPKSRIYVEDGFSHPRIREISQVSSAVRG